MFRNILDNIRDWQICASIDGTGAIGEYIRDGLDWSKFLHYYKQGMAAQKHPNQMRLDFTLTLPGLYEVKNMFELSKELDTMLLAKVTFAFTPDIIMSPLCLPRNLLNDKVDQLLEECKEATWKQQPLIDVLKNLKERPTFQEEWSDEYEQGILKGKQRMAKIDNLRKTSYTIDNILNGEILEWWKTIKV